MPSCQHPSVLPQCRFGVIARAGWLLQWMLVLVLAFDHLSAPFHHHGHRGVANQHEVSAALHFEDDGHVHAAGEEQPRPSHASMAIRFEPSRLGQLAAPDSTDAQIAPLSAVELVAAFDEVAPAQWRLDRSRRSIRSQRNLPPAGRGPPGFA